MNIKKLFIICLIATPMLATAQERTASGNLNQEASWSALKTLIEAANFKAQAASVAANDAQTKANSQISCAQKNMLYDGTSCKATNSFGGMYSLTSQKNCAQKNPITNSCTCPTGYNTYPLAQGVNGFEQYIYMCI